MLSPPSTRLAYAWQMAYSSEVRILCSCSSCTKVLLPLDTQSSSAFAFLVSAHRPL